VHREDACHFKFCFKLAEMLSFHVLENSGELEVLKVARGVKFGDNAPSDGGVQGLGTEGWLSPRCPDGRGAISVRE